jgi:hypothetical protein
MRPPAAWFGTSVACVLALASFCYLIRDGVGGLLRAPLDFTAFRCGGALLARGADPYLVEPLRTCERSSLILVGKHLTPHLVVPAPLPPFALLAFAAFGSLQPPIPSAIWAGLLFAAFIATCLLLRPMTRAPMLVIACALVASGFIASLVIGQLMPIEIAFLAATAAALSAGWPVAAAAAAAAALTEPQIGVPVVLGLALWEPRARLPLCAALLGLAGLSVLPHGPHIALEYLTRVLPAEAATEGLDAAKQFALSAQLALIGVPSTPALVAGAASYVLMTALGLRAGYLLAKRFGEGAFAVLTPPAFALIGGTYVHIHQVAAAIPLALLLDGRVQRMRLTLLAALLLLATPWQTIGEFAIARPLPPQQLTIAEHLMDLVDDDDAPAAGVWGMWVTSSAHNANGQAIGLAEKVPTWLGLLALLTVALDAAFPEALRSLRLRSRARAPTC